MTFSQDQLCNKLGYASCVQHHHRQHKAYFCSCHINEKQGLVHKKILWEFDKDSESFVATVEKSDCTMYTFLCVGLQSK